MHHRFSRLVILLGVAFVAAIVPVHPQTPAQNPPDQKPKVKMAPAPATPASSGHQMFQSYCAQCHGVTGRGDGPVAPALKKAPADLTQLAKKNGGKFPEQRFREVVGQNALVIEHGTSDMPMWGTVFRQMPGGADAATLRVANLMKYVQTLQAK